MFTCVCIYIGKKLLACRTAADGFSSIVEKVGGEQEKIRARYVCSGRVAFTAVHVQAIQVN